MARQRGGMIMPTQKLDDWMSEMWITDIQELESSTFSSYYHNANCGCGSASYYIITDGRQVREPEIDSAEWVDEYDGFNCDDSYVDYEFTNCTWVIEVECSNYKDDHEQRATLYIPAGTNPMDLTGKIKKHVEDIKYHYLYSDAVSGVYCEGDELEAS